VSSQSSTTIKKNLDAEDKQIPEKAFLFLLLLMFLDSFGMTFNDGTTFSYLFLCVWRVCIAQYYCLQKE